MPKLNSKVSTNVGTIIDEIRIDQDIKKGKALKFIIQLAMENPEFPCKDFGSDQSVNCTITLSEKEFEGTKEYRKLHKLSSKTKFLHDAIIRGCSKYIE